MAKTRRPARKKSAKPTKKAAATRRKPARTAAPAKPRKPAAPVPARIELKKLREDFARIVEVLAARRSTSTDVTARLDDTRRRISQWMTDVDDICSPQDQEICGPDMAFPIPTP